jgi:hypothetical protein
MIQKVRYRVNNESDAQKELVSDIEKLVQDFFFFCHIM